MKETRFKQTEIGEIPEDWEVKTLEEIATEFSYGVGAEAVSYNGVDKYIRITDINDEDHHYVPNPIMSPSFFTENHIVKENDLLVARTGASVGKTYLYNSNDGKLIYAGFLMKLNINKEFAPFIFYQTFLKRYSDWVLSESLRTGQPGLNLEQLKKYQICCSSTISEQCRIAESISDIDSLISSLEKLIAKKQNIKQGAMQQLLTGKKRLFGFGNGKYKQTEIGEIPEDWEVKTLDEIFYFFPNNTFSRDCLNDSEGEYQNIHYGDVLIKFPSILDCQKEEIPYINSELSINFARYGVQEGDVIIADTAEDETCGKVTEIYNLGDKKLVSGLHTILCRPKTDDFAPKWLGYFMNYSMYHNQIIPLMTGIKVSSVSKSSILSTKVAIPSKEEQTAITNILSDMDAEIVSLEAKLEKYKQIKTGMMQQLLTGKIRLV